MRVYVSIGDPTRRGVRRLSCEKATLSYVLLNRPPHVWLWAMVVQRGGDAGRRAEMRETVVVRSFSSPCPVLLPSPSRLSPSSTRYC